MVHEREILLRTKRSMLRVMCGVQLKCRKSAKDLMLVLGMNATMDQLAMANGVFWYGHVLKRQDGDVLEGH